MTGSLLAAVCLAAPTPPRAGAGPSFQGLGDLPGGAVGSFGFAVSGNGLVVVGSSASTSGLEAFRWTAGGGMVGLGDLAGGEFGSGASEVSFDGSVIVGGSFSASADIGQFEAFRWTAATGMVGLGDLPQSQFRSNAFGVSADGSVVVGQGASLAAGLNRVEAFRWTAAGMAPLGDLSGGVFWSMATAVSADGATVVGAGFTDIGFEPFKWTAAGGLVALGTSVGNFVAGTPFDISADASTVVGAGTDFSTGRIAAYRWTSGTGFVQLGNLGGSLVISSAWSVSADGAVVVGESRSASGTERQAFIWNAAVGMQNLRTLLTDLGLDLTGWTLSSAEGISDNGRVIVGWGTNPSGNAEGWIATLPVDGDGDGFLPPADCDDGDPGINPGAAEVFDGVDNNCDGTIDEVFDDDGDGFLDVNEGGDDCDDNDPNVNPGATEVDNGLDDNCDGSIDEGFDIDTDGFTPIGGGDCDDGDSSIFPGAPETPDDGIDQDCNGFDTVTCFVDADTDGFGSTAIDLSTDGDCTDPGEATTDTDCDDGDPAINPLAAEVCDGVDNNCEGSIDEGFADADSDGTADCIDDDRDGDGVPNVNDGCPDDPTKIAPGTAGCGNPEPPPAPSPTDQDGVPAAVEDAAPNGGDGNADGIPDAMQNNVTSLPNVNGDYLTIVSPPGTTLENVSSGANPDPATAPPGVSFPAGFTSFRLTGLPPGGSVDLQIIAHLPPGTSLNTYWKFGPTAMVPVPHWYEFLFDGATGATFAGAVVTLTFVDGQRGDADLAANGVIEDPGAIAFAPSTPPGQNPAPGQNQPAGCCAPGVFPTLSLLAPAFLVGRWRLRRRRRSSPDRPAR